MTLDAEAARKNYYYLNSKLDTYFPDRKFNFQKYFLYKLLAVNAGFFSELIQLVYGSLGQPRQSSERDFCIMQQYFFSPFLTILNLGMRKCIQKSCPITTGQLAYIN